MRVRFSNVGRSKRSWTEVLPKGAYKYGVVSPAALIRILRKSRALASVGIDATGNTHGAILVGMRRCGSWELVTPSEAMLEAMTILNSYGSCSASVFGFQMWGKKGRKPQTYCRPAARLLSRMEADGLAQRSSQEEGPDVWSMTEQGRGEWKAFN